MSDIAEEVARRVRRRAELEKMPIPANISRLHFHLTESDFETLFGKGKKPTKLRDLVQPGQFACAETLTLIGPKGEIPNVRMIGPCRPYTQVEVSQTDAIRLGIQPPVRDSGNLKGSAGLTLAGPAGRVELKEGVILQQRHIHFHPREAEKFGVKGGDLVRIRAGRPPKEVILENVLCRVREDMRLECHLDTDEGNACGLHNGDFVYIL